jgi:uncharacterized membrane protein YphA (DoxX/SURF4 family)
MKTQNSRPYTITRYITGLCLILAGIGTLIDNKAAVATVHYSFEDFREMLPGDAEIHTTVISLIEILAGIALLAKKFLSPAIISGGMIVLVFVIPLGQVWFKKMDIPSCGGFGFFDFGISVQMAFIRYVGIYSALAWMQFVVQEDKKSLRRHS